MPKLYDKLLISAGGGIISRDQQAEQDNCATICLGLGGTGISCLRALKKEIYTRVKPDADSVITPKYKHIKFLAVDTDKGSIGDTGSIDTLDSNTEFFNISCSDIHGLLREAHILQQDQSLQWLKTANTQGDGSGISILSADAGAGGVRQVGRLLLLRSCKNFIAKLTNLINEARKDLNADASINIHIFTGLGGGTGAGTFLDACYLVQHALGQIGLAGQAYTCGYFFMPDVNMAKAPGIDYVPINGFASMKELDYCMNYPNNGGEWDQQYDGFRIKTSEPPVKIAHLITATSSDGTIVSNAYDYAMHVAVDYVLEYIIKPHVAEGDNPDTDGTFSIKSHIANVNALIEMVDKKHGACYNYCILGAANAYLPYKEITTYLASKIFEGFSSLEKQLPSENDIERFVIANGLKYEDILRTLNDKAPAIPNMAVDHKELYEQVAGITPDIVPPLLKQRLDALSAISGKFSENSAALLDADAVPALNNAEKLVSLIARVKKALIETSIQSDKGPYYAGAVIHNLNSRDLLNKVTGYREQNTRNIAQAQANLGLRDRELADALSDFQNSNGVNRKKRCENYVMAFQNYLLERVRLNMLNVMGDVLIEFHKQLDSLYAGYFGIFADVMANLQETFNTNLRNLAEPVVGGSGYAVKIMTIQDLQSSLDSTVSRMDIPTLVSSFVNMMLTHPDNWIAQDENKICATVSDYFLSELDTYCKKTITDYLQIKFDTTNPEVLKHKIYEEIVLPLGDRSTPMFWTNSIYQLSDSKAMGYISVPVVSDEIKSAALDYKAGHDEIKVRTSWSSDRITVFRFNCGIPMFGYKGVTNYKSAYSQKAIIGSHLYEGSVRDPRDSRKFIDIAPISTIPDYSLTDSEKKYIDIYEKALQSGLISKIPVGQTHEYRINIYDAEKVNTRCNFAAAIIESENPAKAKAILEDIKADPYTVVGSRVIPNTGKPENADKIIKDHVIGSQNSINLIMDQMAIIEKQEATVAALEKIIAGKNEFISEVHGFALAMATGAIRILNKYTYAYVTEMYGIEDVNEITNMDSAPYGMSIPVYSAFLAYHELNADTKALIEKNMKMNLIDDAKVDAALKNVAEILTKVNAFVALAKSTYPDQADDIYEFLTKFTAEVKNFMATR